MRKKCKRLSKLLNKGPLLKEERERARKISRGIEGFGSFCLRTLSDQESSLKTFERSNSQFIDRSNQEGLSSNEIDLVHTNTNTESSRTQLHIEPSKPLLSEQRDESSGMNTSTNDHHPFDDAEHLTCLSLLSTA